jgi:hypothetical protein
MLLHTFLGQTVVITRDIVLLHKESKKDKRNFIYYSVLNWKTCNVEMRTQSRYNFICSCKLLT